MSTKTKSRGLSLGTGTDQISALTFSGAYTPSNYTPAQVGSEGNAQISAHLKGIDARFGTPFVDQLLSWSSNTVTVAQAFAAGTLLDVYANGVLLEEGSDYTRTVIGNTISLTSAGFNSSSRIRVRVWL